MPSAYNDGAAAALEMFKLAAGGFNPNAKVMAQHAASDAYKVKTAPPAVAPVRTLSQGEQVARQADFSAFMPKGRFG